MKFLALGLLLISSLALGQQTGSQKKYDPPFNLLDNGNFEKKLSGWTNSGGTFSHVVSGSNLIFDKGSATFDASATSQYIQSKLYTVPEGLKSANCMGRLYYKGGDSNLVLKVLDGSSNLLGSATFSAASSTLPLSVVFVCPSSGSIRLRVESTANAAIVALDNAHIGISDNMLLVGQASLWGGSTWPATANCTWSNSATSWQVYSADTDCTNPSGSNLQGYASAPSTKVPGIKFDTMPAGRYLVLVSGPLYKSTTSSGSCEWRVHDGTNAWRGESVASSTTAAHTVSTLVAEFEYTTAQSNVTLQLQEQSLAGETCTIPIDNSVVSSGLTIQVYKFPSVQETAFKPDAVANSWSGYHDGADCVWSTTSTSFVDPAIDASCTFTQRTNTNFGTVTSYNDGTPGNNYPGIVFTPSRPGTYQVCAVVSLQNGTSGSNADMQLTDGTAVIGKSGVTAAQSGAYVQMPSVCGQYKATSTSSVTLKLQLKATGGGTAYISTSNSSGADAVAWSIFQVDQALPAPLLVNSVVSPSAGVEQIVRAFITNPGSCAVSTQSGSWIGSVADPAAGECQINIAAGTFSSTPSCVCSMSSNNAGFCQIKDGATSTSLIAKTHNDAGTAVDENFNIMCMGPK